MNIPSFITKNKTSVLCGGSMVAIDVISVALFHHGPFDVALDLLCGGMMGVATMFFIPEKSLSWDEYMASKMKPVEGLNMTEAASDIRKVTEETAKIRAAMKDIRNPNVNRQLIAITAVCDKLVTNFKNDPRDITTAKLWIDQYFPKFREQVVRYQELSIKGTYSSEAQDVLVKFEKMLPGVLDSYQGILDDCLKNDITDLSVGTGVYKKLIDGGSI